MKRTTELGAALVAALMVVAIAAASAAGLLYAQTLWMVESDSNTDAAQARIAARAGIAWAAALLQQDVRTSTSDHDNEIWAMPLPRTDFEGGSLSGSIRDLQGRFNINNLVRDGVGEPKAIASFRRLLATLGLSPDLADSAVDWMDTDAELHGPNGAEDAYYLAQSGGYRTAGRPLADIHELLRIKGYSTAVFTLLKPYVAALAAPSAINVNTAPPEVLSSLGNRISLADARTVQGLRERREFRDVADFMARIPAAVRLGIDAVDVRTSSEYFLLEARIQRNRSIVDAEAIIHRTAPWPRVIWQRIDG